MILLLFTTSYPYDYATEQTFLKGEVEILSKRFERVILVPRITQGNYLPVSEGVEVDTSFASTFTAFNRIYSSALSLFSKDFYLDLKTNAPAFRSPAYLRKLFSFLSGASLTRRWMKNWLNVQKVSAADTICYTYWFDEITMGLGLAKESHTGLRVISRAHGYDLYEELYGIWPCRRRAIGLIDGLFSASAAGEKYLFKKYPEFSEKVQTALLGVADPGGISKPSEDGVLRIVSCSMLYAIKRVDLLLDGIACAARKCSGQLIEWRHFGGGDERGDFIMKIGTEFPSNAKGDFPGFIPQKELINNYLEQPVDVFVNVSSTEGTPVSIMEAVSCGIPVIATAVGGNVEIVSEKNGFLLSENPTPEEIAETLLRVCDQREEMSKKRQGSRQIWSERYNEATNFEAFAQKIVEIRNR